MGMLSDPALIASAAGVASGAITAAGAWLTQRVRSRRTERTAEARVEVARTAADTAALPLVLDRLTRVEGRLEHCESRHDEQERRATRAESAAVECERRARVLSDRIDGIEQLESQLAQRDDDVRVLARRLAETRASGLPDVREDTGLHELEEIARRPASTPTPPRSMPPARARTMRDTED